MNNISYKASKNNMVSMVNDIDHIPSIPYIKAFIFIFFLFLKSRLPVFWDDAGIVKFPNLVFASESG